MARPWPLGGPGHRGRGGGRGGISVAGRGVFPGRLVRFRGQGAPAPATAAVTRQDLSATTPVTATLGYAGSYPVTGHSGGTLTWLPPPGQVTRQGQVLYKTGNGSPVVLLYGSVPDWRALDEGITGQDVTQLNHDLVDLGYAGRADISALGWDYYSWETAYGVQRLEEHLGVSSPPGIAVFGAGGIRAGGAAGQPGDREPGRPGVRAGAGGDVGPARGDDPAGRLPAERGEGGDTVTVTLPDGTTTPGVVSSVGTVATTTSGQQGQGPVTTIPVQVTLTDRGAAGTLDQAPVTVNITTATAKNVLGCRWGAAGSVLRGVRRGGRRPGEHAERVPVTPGIFDDADGLVQVTGALTPGQRVVVPAL